MKTYLVLPYFYSKNPIIFLSKFILTIFFFAFLLTNVNGENSSEFIKIEDESLTAVCYSNIQLALDATGNAILTPAHVDAGSNSDAGGLTYELDREFFDCTDVGQTFTVFLTVTDESGATNQCWTSVLIEDKMWPTAICNSLIYVSLGPDGTATLTPDMIDAGSTDNCSPLTYELSQSEFDCSDVGESIVVLMTVTDVGGNSNQCWTEVVIEDKLAPVITCPADLTIECSQAGNLDPINTGTPFVDDNCDLIGYSYQDQYFSTTGAGYNVIRTWTVVDWNSGASQECEQHIDVIDITAPQIICLNSLSASLDFSGSLTLYPEDFILNVSDQCDSVSLSISQSEFDCSDIGSSFVTVTAVDGSGNANECIVELIIQDNASPIAICNSVVNVSLGPDGTATITPEVIDGGSYDACGPVTLSIDQSTFDCSDIQENNVVVLTVTDASGNTNECWTQIIVEDKLGPVVTCPADITLDCSVGQSTDPELTGYPTVSDNCTLIGTAYDDQYITIAGASFKILRTWTVIDWYSGISQECIQVITVLDITAPNIICVTTLSASLDINGSLTLYPEDFVVDVTDDCDQSIDLSIDQSEFDCSDIGSSFVTVTAIDGSGNANECIAELIIQDNTAPIAICNSQVNVSLGPDGTATITPEIIDGGSYDACGPVTLSIDQSTFDCSDIQENNVVVLTVTDASGNTNECWSQIIVEDKLGPVVTCPADITLDCSVGQSPDPELTGYPTVLDNCTLIGTAYDDQYITITGASFKILRTWTAFDWYSGISQECIQVITVLDITAPNIICVNALSASLDINGSLTLYPEDFVVDVTDDCDQSIDLSIDQSEFDCSDIGSSFVTVTAVDGSGNANECIVELIIQDNTAPIAICNSQVNVSLGPDGTATITPEIIDGGSYDACGPVTLSIDQSTFDCSDIQENNVVVLTVTDASGNTNECWAQVVVEDKTPPVISCPFDLTIECSQAGNLDPIFTGTPVVEDNCSVIGTTYEDTEFQLDGSNYKVIREWIIVDWFTNTFDTCIQEMTIIDLNAPNIVCLNQLSASLDANGQLTLFAEDFDAGTSDDCGEFDLTINQSQFDCTDVGNSSITLTATDENGNSSQCVVGLTIFAQDSDGDGFNICDGDCDDNNASISPASPEVCGDNIDNNCDGNVDENCICASFAQSTQYEWIQSIAVNSVSNNSGDDGGYGDYTAISLAMNIGDNDITLTPGFAGSSYDEYWSVWIDMNHNGIYENSEEVLSDNSFGTINSSIDIPNSALLGTTTMRIAMKYAQSSNPCEIFAEGEVEDYTVEISEADYCLSSGQSTQYEWIKKVRLKSINNLSGNDNGYADYTNLSTNLNPGQSKNINLKPAFSNSAYLEYWRVWVDWNEDGDFDDGGELEVQVSSSGNITGQITVPANASAGDKIMRVSMKYGGYANPCEVFTYGEVEDYTIFITGNNPLIVQEENIEDIALDKAEDQLKSIEKIETRDLDQEWEVSVYPNPTSYALNVKINTSLDQESQLLMYNDLGQLVYDVSTSQNNHSINVANNNFANGWYVITIKQGNQMTSKKVLVMK